MGIRQQRGAALIIVLLLFAVLVALSVEVLYRQDHFRTRTSNLLGWDQRYQHAIAAETLAIQALIDDLEDDQDNNELIDDCIHEEWAITLPPSPVENVFLSASVQDLQARFNLNSLVSENNGEYILNPPMRQALEQLLAATLPEPSVASALSMEMADWIDSNNLVDEANGAEDAEYRDRRTPNIPIPHESEMRALRSFTLAQTGAEPFWGFYTALPEMTPVNVNTAPEPVLDALFQFGPGNAASRAIIEQREQAAFADIGEVLALAPLASLSQDDRDRLTNILDVRSSFFQVMIDVRSEEGISRLVTRIRRLNDGPTEVFSRQLVPVMGPLEPACNPLYNSATETPAANGENSADTLGNPAAP